ncbi:hypothetical protein V6N13_038846 [Hibiscus sabdariffa]
MIRLLQEATFSNCRNPVMNSASAFRISALFGLHLHVRLLQEANFCSFTWLHMFTSPAASHGLHRGLQLHMASHVAYCNCRAEFLHFHTHHAVVASCRSRFLVETKWSPPAEDDFVKIPAIRKGRLLQKPNHVWYCRNWPRLPINFALAILGQLKLVGGLSAKFCPSYVVVAWVITYAWVQDLPRLT